MDLQVLMSQLLSKDSIQGLSQASGASQKDVKNVISSALPMLLNGANEQAQNQETAGGFAGALAQHAASNTSDLSAFFKNVDLADGAKIVSHLLGEKTQSQTQSVSKKAGVSASQTGSILSAAAPLLMSLLGQQSQQEEKEESSPASLLTALLGKADVASLAMTLLGSLKDDEEEEEEPKDKKKKKKKTSKKDEKDGGLDLGGILTSLLK